MAELVALIDAGLDWQRRDGEPDDRRDEGPAGGYSKDARFVDERTLNAYSRPSSRITLKNSALRCLSFMTESCFSKLSSR